jgi:hypothetical protein
MQFCNVAYTPHFFCACNYLALYLYVQISMRTKGVPNKKSGEIKAIRLELRVSNTTIRKLEWLRKHWTYSDRKTNADLITHLIDQAIKDQERTNEIFNPLKGKFINEPV